MAKSRGDPSPEGGDTELRAPILHQERRPLHRLQQLHSGVRSRSGRPPHSSLCLASLFRQLELFVFHWAPLAGIFDAVSMAKNRLDLSFVSLVSLVRSAPWFLITLASITTDKHSSLEAFSSRLSFWCWCRFWCWCWCWCWRSLSLLAAVSRNSRLYRRHQLRLSRLVLVRHCLCLRFGLPSVVLGLSAHLLESSPWPSACVLPAASSRASAYQATGTTFSSTPQLVEVPRATSPAWSASGRTSRSCGESSRIASAVAGRIVRARFFTWYGLSVCFLRVVHVCWWTWLRRLAPVSRAVGFVAAGDALTTRLCAFDCWRPLYRTRAPP